MNAPLTPDQNAAHEFLAELRTRISTQPLPYQYGVEAQALESLWAVFAQARDAIKKYPGCEKFAVLTSDTLNLALRPITDKWHHAHAAGRLDSRDGANAFREDFLGAQQALRDLADQLHQMAYGRPLPDKLTPEPMTAADLTVLFAPMNYGLPRGTPGLPDPLIEVINADEAQEIQARRNRLGIATSRPGQDAIGLAFSGGGIRSATFSLGVVQVLVDRGLFKEVDYLSTVSGGGYTGSFLTMLYGCTNEAEAGHSRGPDPDYVRYVRHHAKFLNPLNLKDAWNMVTQTIAGMILNWCVPLFLVVSCAIMAAAFSGPHAREGWRFAAIITAGGAALGLVFYGMSIRSGHRLRLAGRWILALSVGLAGGAAAGWLLEIFYGVFVARFQTTGSHWSWSVASLFAAAVAAAPTVLRFSAVLQNPTARKWAMKAALVLAGALIPVGAMLLFFLCRHYIGTPYENSNYTEGMKLMLSIAGILAVVAFFIVNVNLTAPHRLYRDRLAQTFIHIFDGPLPVPFVSMPTRTRHLFNSVVRQVLPDKQAHQVREFLDDQNRVPLAQINPSGRAPYHLLNTTLNLPSSEEPSLRDRKCAFFLFSKHWCGAGVIGYWPTSKWRTNGKPVDLATSMAISGAAASSQMGLGSMPLLSPLLTFLNIRLGFWIRRPDRKVLSENAGFGNLLREMTGAGMSEKDTWMNLSDGGHSENTGVYELLRRHCKFIICVDGEADPDFTFGGLMTLVRHAQIDLGIQIDPPVDEIRQRPDSLLSQAHSLLCRVRYPANGALAAGTGLLLYLKLSVTGDESQLIRRYHTLNADFPHESTADQFFQEDQFEAYRQLGAHVAEGLFAPALIGRATPTSVPAWFKVLAGKLLLPAA
jgi:hypothetical protein